MGQIRILLALVGLDNENQEKQEIDDAGIHHDDSFEVALKQAEEEAEQRLEQLKSLKTQDLNDFGKNVPI